MAIHQDFVNPIEEEFIHEEPIREEVVEEEEIIPIPIRTEFPIAGDTQKGGESDGYQYKTTFAGTTLKHSYQMVKAFLEEEGYGEVPIPKDEQALSYFRLQTRNKQILLFEENGYIHNPIKILFPPNRRNKRTLILCIYNESDPDHLLKFHRKGPYLFENREQRTENRDER